MQVASKQLQLLNAPNKTKDDLAELSDHTLLSRLLRDKAVYEDLDSLTNLALQSSRQS